MLYPFLITGAIVSKDIMFRHCFAKQFNLVFKVLIINDLKLHLQDPPSPQTIISLGLVKPRDCGVDFISVQQ